MTSKAFDHAPASTPLLPMRALDEAIARLSWTLGISLLETSDITEGNQLESEAALSLFADVEAALQRT